MDHYQSWILGAGNTGKITGITRGKITAGNLPRRSYSGTPPVHDSGEERGGMVGYDGIIKCDHTLQLYPSTVHPHYNISYRIPYLSTSPPLTVSDPSTPFSYPQLEHNT